MGLGGGACVSKMAGIPEARRAFGRVGQPVPPDGPRRQSGWRRSEPGLWLLLIVLTALGLSDDLTTLALYMFMLPALPLIFAPTILYYVLLLQVPRMVWRAGKSWMLTLGAGVAVLALGNAPVVVVNAQLDARAAAATAEDFGAPPSLPDLSSVALVEPDAKSCSQFCKRLLVSGVVQAVVVSDRIGDDFSRGIGRASEFRLGDGRACAVAEGGNQSQGDTCLVRREIANGFPDAIIVVHDRLDTTRHSGGRDYADRMNPFSAGPWSRARLTVWACESVCAIAMQRTEVVERRLTAPMWLSVETHGLALKRSWSRDARTRNAIDLDALVGGIKGGSAAGDLSRRRLDVKPPELEVAVSIASIEAMAAPKLRDPGVSQLIAGWSRQDAPLTPRQLALLRRVLLQPQTQMHFDWIKHPEAAEAMRDDLGDVLLDGRGPKYMTVAAIGSLSEEGLQRASPKIRQWIEKRGVLTGSDLNDTFLIRLGELGPGLVDALKSAWDPDRRTLRIYGGINSALLIGVCRLGPEARELMPLLELARTRIAEREPSRLDKHIDRYYEQFLPLTIERVSRGSPGRSACIEAMLATERPPVRKEWLERIRAMDR